MSCWESVGWRMAQARPRLAALAVADDPNRSGSSQSGPVEPVGNKPLRRRLQLVAQCAAT